MPNPTFLLVIHMIFTAGTAFLAGIALYRSGKPFRTRRFLNLEQDILAQDAAMVVVQAHQKKLNAKYALLIAREKSNGKEPEPESDAADYSQQPGESAEAWKKRCRLAHAAGRIQHK